ncbi:MAG: hypothetical protein IPP17_10690 [Bacteroidetes bacterium]|nr:hypothetical protein [Bacteroidota bacterium]
MNTIDVSSKWIVKMFKFNSRETDGFGCQFYENGIQGNLVGIQSSELVFGIAQIDNTTYYFTEGALMVNGPHLKIGWNEVSTISGSFRSSHKIIHIETLSRIKIALPIAKFPYRIQQLETVAQPQAKIPTSSIKFSEVFFAFGKSVYFPNPGSGGGSGIDF